VGAHSLEENSRAHSRLREVEAWDLLRDAAQALQWMSESMGVPHLNIKPGNILKFQKRYKLADPYTDPMILQAYLRK
jgi:serine/threonine protein kinase